MTDLTVSGLAVLSVEVGPVAVLVPPGSFVRQGTVSDSDVIVSVFCREGPALVVAERVTYDQEEEEFITSAYTRQHWYKYKWITAWWEDINDQQGGRWRNMRGSQRKEALLQTLNLFRQKKIIIISMRGWQVILAYGHVDRWRDTWRVRTRVEIWRSAEASFRHQGEEDVEEKGERRKIADGIRRMREHFCLKVGKSTHFTTSKYGV